MYICSVVAQPTAITPAAVSSAEGDNITITCTATGVPVPSVTWSRADNSSLTDSRYIISNTSSTIVITDMDFSDTYQVTRNLTIINFVATDVGAVYVCTVSNVVGTVQSDVTIISELIISLGTLVPNSRDRHEKQWRPDFTRHKTHPKIRFV